MKTAYNLSETLKNQIATDPQVAASFEKFKIGVGDENIVGARVALLEMFDKMKANTPDIGEHFEAQVWPKAATSDYAYLQDMCKFEFS